MKTLLVAILMFVFLSGCGGMALNDEGYDSMSIEDVAGLSGSTTILTGRFLDSAVEGIDYTSGSVSGTTDSSGNFQYIEGQTVSFSVGDVTIGSGTSGEVMTPVDLVEVGNTDTAEVVNIAGFLQTLDDDRNPDKGILVTSSVKSTLKNVSALDFKVLLLQFELVHFFVSQL